MLVQKHLFFTPRLDLETGDSIPVTIGYETYGQLNPNRDNAVLICHPFAASGHAAGRYHPDDANPGWWDALIGPGRAFDTDRYCVIAVDTLCSLHVRNPLVITTGPATVDPATQRPYGASFPQVTMRDNVRLQYQLITSLGINRLVCVAGPGTGGFQALEWAVTYPKAVERVVTAASAPKAPPVFALAVCQAGIDAIQADLSYGRLAAEGERPPTEGLVHALRLMEVLSSSDQWLDGQWGRRAGRGSLHPRLDPAGRFAFDLETEGRARALAAEADADHFVRSARACLLHDIGYGNRGLEVAAQMIHAELLMLPVTSDLLFPPEASRELVDLVRAYGGRAELVTVETGGGHRAAVTESHRLAEPIHHFLSRATLH